MENKPEYQDKELECKGCMGPCGQCEDEDLVYYEYEDEDDDFDDGVCCWEIRYKGPKDYCHCKAYADEEARQAKWGWILRPLSSLQSLPFRLYNWWWKAKRKYLPTSVVCDNCEHKHWYVGNETKCPKCGNYNLPF